MCGLVGVSGIVIKKHEDAFKTLLILDALRGIDSTGVALVSKDGDVDVVKALGNPYELLDYKPFERRMARQNKLLMGHNRFGTQGAISKNNAHPFEFEHIVGAHNGTLTNKWALRGHEHHAVDSQALYSHMNEHGVNVTVPKLQGAWSLTWYDKRNESINFLRNKERPMHYAFTKDGNTLIWASEAWMLRIACARNGVEIEEVKETEENMLYSYESGTLAELNREEIKGDTFFPVEQGVWRHGRWVGHQQQQQQQTTQPQTTKSGAEANQSVTPTGKVVTFPQKTATQEALDNVGKSFSAAGRTGFVAGYSGKKNVVLEVLNEGVTNEGAKYLVCFDPEVQSATIRLFIKKSDDPAKYMDREIIADIGKYHYKADEFSGGFYKVEYSSHRMAQKLEEFPDSKGKMIPANEWVNRHGTCCWCSSPIFPNDVHKFVNGNDDVLCQDCVADPEVNQYIS